jgi:hypothetical protein
MSNKKVKMTVCQIKKILTVWNGHCNFSKHKKKSKHSTGRTFKIESE